MNKQPSVNHTFLIIILGVLAALGPFTIDMYLPGFVKIAEDLKTTEASVSLTLTSYFIGISAGQLFYGPIIDRFGRKIPLLAGLLLYILAALACAMATNIDQLILYRLLQALGGCVGMVASNAIISDVYDKEGMAKAFSSILLVMGIAPIIAPTLGGFLINEYSWRSIFYFLTIIGTVVWFVIAFFLPNTHNGNRNISLKPIPIIKTFRHVVRNPVFIKYTLAASISMAIMFAYIAGASFVFLQYYGLSEKAFGILFGCNAFGFIVGSTLNGKLIRKYELYKISLNASFLQMVVTFMLVILILFIPELPYYFVLGGVFFSLFFLGFINPNTTAISLSSVRQEAGTASALSGSIRMGVGAIASAIVGLVIHYGVIALGLLMFILALASFLIIYSDRPANNAKPVI